LRATGGILLEEGGQLLAHDGGHDALHLAVAQLGLGLALELRVRHLDAHHRGQALADVVARHALRVVLDQLVGLAVLVHRPRQRGAEPGQVRAALHRVDVVDVGEDGVAVGVRILQRDLHHHAVLLALQRDHLGVQRLLVLVQVRDELGDAALVEIQLLPRRLLLAQLDLQPAVQEGQLAQPVGQRVPVELNGRKDRGVGEERHLRARALALADLLHLGDRLAGLEAHVVDEPVALDLHLQPLAQRVHARHAHAVQPARHLVRVVIELAARMQHGQHDLERGALLGLVHVHRDAAAVVHHRHRPVRVHHHFDVFGVSGERLVHAVVHHLVDQVMQPAHARVADIHGRPLAHGFEPGQHRDVVRAVSGRVRRGRLFRNRLCGNVLRLYLIGGRGFGR
jgi:hypothetical protein